MVNRSIGQAFVVFALLGAALYANALGNSFHYDDRHSIEHNKHLRSLANIPSYFVDPGTFSSERRGTMFRPLLLSSYAANYAVHGGWVPGYRIANLLIHVLCSTLLFALAHKWWGIPRDAWALGLLFLLHPLHGEPINYISSRSDLLVGCFYLLAVLWSVERPYGSWSAFAAALMSKSVAITLPIVVWAAEWIRDGRVRLRNRYLAGVLLLSGVYLTTIVANRFLTSSLAKTPRTFDVQLWTQTKALVYYIWLFCMPRALSVEHPFVVADRWSDPVVVLAGLVLLSLGGLAIVGRRRVEAQAFGFFVLALLPATLMPLNILVSERRMYLASTGLVVIAVWAWGQMAARRRRFAIITGSSLCLVFAAMVWTRNPVWLNDITLWEDAVAKGPGMFRARANLGLAYGKQERWLEAINELEQALVIKGDYADAWVELGNIYHDTGQLELAERAYRQALALDPSLEGVYYNLGNLAMGRKDVDGAMRFYRETLERNPGFADAHNNLGQALELTGDFAAARQQYEAAIIDNPHLGGTWFNLGGVAERLGDKQQALVAYRRAQELLVALPEYQTYAVRAEQAIQRLE